MGLLGDWIGPETSQVLGDFGMGLLMTNDFGKGAAYGFQAMEDRRKKGLLSSALQGNDPKTLGLLMRDDPELGMKVQQARTQKADAARQRFMGPLYQAAQNYKTNPQAFDAIKAQAVQGGFSDAASLTPEAAQSLPYYDAHPFQIQKMEHERQMMPLQRQLLQSQVAETQAQARRYGAMADNGGNPRAPAGYMYSADGSSLIAIPGGPADPATKGFNEMQSKANIFAQRAAEAERQINEFGKALTSPLQQMGNAIPGIGNYFTSKEFQMADQAKRNMVNAFLRRESGAAISEQEFKNADTQYFPQPGDSPEVIRQKAQNRQTQIRAIAQEAGPAYRGEAVQSAGPELRSGPGGLAFQTESQADLNTAVQGLIAKGGRMTQGQDGSQIIVMPDGRRFQIEGGQ